MQQARAHGHRLVSGGTLLMIMAASVALLAIASYKPRADVAASPVAVLASVGLTDDDGGQGLFQVSGLVPGRPVSRCLKVNHAGQAGGTVYVSAAQVTGQLAGNLRIRLEQGNGGGFASCAGFTGTTVYDGLLSDLQDPDPAAPRTTTGWNPAAADSRTFRVTATVQDVAAAQGRTGTAQFRWFLVGAPAPAPAPTQSPTPAPSSSPTSEPSAAPSSSAPAPAGTTAPPTGAAPEPFAAVGSTAGPRPTGDRPGVTTGMGANRDPRAPAAAPRAARAQTPAAPAAAPMARIAEALAQFGRDVTEVAVRSTTHSVLPLIGALVLLAFLVLQNRIDRLDPQLGLRAAQDPHLTFRDPRADDALPPSEDDVAHEERTT